MHTPRLPSLSPLKTRPACRLLAVSMATGLMFLAACGSDKGTVADGNTKPGGGTTTPDVSIVNSDKTGSEATFMPTSTAFKTTRNGTDTAMPYVQLSSNANATNPNKAYSLTAYTYDICIFSANHGYTTFPKGKFDFVGFYLVNQTPGAALAPGVYKAGATSGMYINMTDSGAGYDITACKASNYPTVASGEITIDTLGTGKAPTAGSLNVTMTDGSVFSGTFNTGTCSGGNGAQPNPPANDPYACAKIN